MNRNILKIIACITMLIDHMGYILFPDIEIFRLIGRIAMPIFAFFIGEGCLYTKNKKKYFLRVFLLGGMCQAVYIAESVITKSDNWAYLNILLTFSVSIVFCYSFLYFKKAVKEKSEKRTGAIVQFVFVVAGVLLIEYFCLSSEGMGISVQFDYGIFGFVLPVFVAVTKDKNKKLISFCVAHIIMACYFYGVCDYYFCSLIPLVLLLFYNGKPGKKNLKYFFYAFYPLHLALLYGISFIM